MKKYCLVVLLLLGNNLFSAKNNVNYNFVFDRKVDLNIPDLFLSDLIQVKYIEDHKIFVLDEFVQKTYLIDPYKKTFQEINLEKIFPGKKWLPFRCAISGTEIYIQTSDMTGNIYVFDINGKYLYKMNNKYFKSILNFIVNDKNEIIAYISLADKEIFLGIFNRQGMLKKKFGKFDDEMVNIVYRHIDKNGLGLDDNNNIYQLNVSSHKIHKFDKSGKYICTFDTQPSFYKPLSTDIPGGIWRTQSDIKKAVMITNNYTFPLNLFVHDGNIIITLFATKKGFGYSMISDKGKVLKLRNDIFKYKLVDVYQKKLIFINQPEQILNGHIPNPELFIYFLQKENL